MSKSILQEARECLSTLESEAHSLGMRLEYRHDLAQNIRAAFERLEQAEAELESKARRLDSLRTALVAHIDWEADQPEVQAFILRKQAEAIQEWLYGEDEDCMGDLKDYIDSLYRKADEIEAKE